MCCIDQLNPPLLAPIPVLQPRMSDYGVKSRRWIRVLLIMPVRQSCNHQRLVAGFLIMFDSSRLIVLELHALDLLESPGDLGGRHLHLVDIVLGLIDMC